MNLNLFRFRIFGAESFHGDSFHDLRSHRAVGIIGLRFCDIVHMFHAFDDFAKRGVGSVQMGGILMHDKEVWSRKAAYLLDILSLLEFVDNKLTTIFVLNGTG